MTSSRRILLQMAALVALTSAVMPLAAQTPAGLKDWPNRPIRVIVPSPPVGHPIWCCARSRLV